MRTSDAPLKARLRAARPRRDRIAVSIPRSAFHLLAAAGVGALALAFAAGWWIGRGTGEAPPRETTTRVVLTEAAAPPARGKAGPKAEEAPVEEARLKAEEAPVEEARSKAEQAPVEEALPVEAPPPGAEPSPPPSPAPPPPVVAPPPAPPPVVEILEDGPSRGHGIQIGAFPERREAMDFIGDNAEALAELPVHVIATKLPGRGTWYRVRVGRFVTKKAAESARLALPPDLTKSSMVVRYR